MRIEGKVLTGAILTGLICAPLVQTALAETAQPAAVAELSPLASSDVKGEIRFEPKGEGKVTVSGTITGLTPGPHGFHVHEVGDCSAPDGSSAGAHFAPEGHPHGARDAEKRHAGDLGNVIADQTGTAMIEFEDEVLKLSGENSIVGRALVVHAAADDLESQPSGNSGARIACGVIRESAG